MGRQTDLCKRDLCSRRFILQVKNSDRARTVLQFLYPYLHPILFPNTISRPGHGVLVNSQHFVIGKQPQGEIVQTEIYDRSITIGVRHIRKIPTTVGIATGAEKSRAVAAAIRGGFVNTLIVDSLLAQALLSHDSSHAELSHIGEHRSIADRVSAPGG